MYIQLIHYAIKKHFRILPAAQLESKTICTTLTWPSRWALPCVVRMSLSIVGIKSLSNSTLELHLAKASTKSPTTLGLDER